MSGVRRRLPALAVALLLPAAVLAGCGGGGAGALEIGAQSGVSLDRPAGVGTFWASFGAVVPCLRASDADHRVRITAVRLDGADGVVGLRAGITHGESSLAALGSVPRFSERYAQGTPLTDYVPVAPATGSGARIDTVCSDDEGSHDPELVVSLEGGEHGASVTGLDVDYLDDGAAHTAHVPWPLRLCGAAHPSRCGPGPVG